MNNNKNTIDVLSVAVNVINVLSGNIAGGTLLANALYMKNGSIDKFRKKRGFSRGTFTDDAEIFRDQRRI